MTIARALTERIGDKRKGQPEAIYTVVVDGDRVHCMTEGMLDAWWNALSPEEKAEIYEMRTEFTPCTGREINNAADALIARFNKLMQLQPQRL